MPACESKLVSRNSRKATAAKAEVGNTLNLDIVEIEGRKVLRDFASV